MVLPHMCGLSKRAFWILMIILGLILAAAIGTGVGIGVTGRSEAGPSANISVLPQVLS